MSIRIGVVGLRFGAQVHVPPFRTDPRSVVVAAAGRDVERTRAIAGALDIPEVHPDWRALLADESIDAVSIAVPPVAQTAIIVAAARAGKHVFCEKPLAASLDDAERAVECVRQANVVHAMDFIFPEIPAWQQAAALLREGAIGEPRHFSYTWKVQTFASRTKANSWKTRTEDGGGAVGNFLCHVLFNLEWLLGEIAAVDNLPRRTQATPACFSDCVAYLTSGVHGNISIATDAFLGGGHQLQVFGDHGTLVLSNRTSDHGRGFELSVGGARTGCLELVAPAPTSPAEGDGRVAPAGRIVRRFLDAVESGGSVTPNLEHGLHVQRWLDRIGNADLR